MLSNKFVIKKIGEWFYSGNFILSERKDLQQTKRKN
jgi:hypothetical protein